MHNRLRAQARVEPWWAALNVWGLVDNFPYPHPLVVGR
jgi:hypothetical protein